MGLIIAVSNQKGGCGKSTTTDNVSDILANRGYKVLNIELDPQGSLSLIHKCKNHPYNLYTLIKNNEFIPLEIKENRYIIPASSSAEGIHNEFSSVLGKELLLSDILNQYKDMYDYILLDCPPQFTLLTDMAMTAADCILVPVSMDLYSIDGLVELNARANLIRKLYNPDLYFLGIVLTNAKLKTNTSKIIRDMAENAKKHLHTGVYTTMIRNSVVVPDAQFRFKTLLEYKANANVTQDYISLTNEILESTHG